MTLREQMRCCFKSRNWIVLMVYLAIINIVNALFSAGTFYYCNWVLGSYNDGFTQALFYALGQAPLGMCILLFNPLAKKIGKCNSMLLGMVFSTAGVLFCLLNPHSLPIVLAGQFTVVHNLLRHRRTAHRVSSYRCDNPILPGEAQRIKKNLVPKATKDCVNCGLCAENCPAQAISREALKTRF